MGKDLSGKSLPRLVKGLEDQGVTTRLLTGNGGGWMLRFPNGSSTVLHRSTSDRRAILNMKAFIKRAGLQWPLDKNFKSDKNSIAA